jgi:hypothetical protein
MLSIWLFCAVLQEKFKLAVFKNVVNKEEI